MDIDIIPFLSFMLATTFSPGPNNLTCLSLGLKGGFKKALPFSFGVYIGVGALLFISGLIKLAADDFLLRYIIFIRIAGTGYLSWLAFGYFRSTGEIKKEDKTGNLLKGIFLQLMNPKSYLFVISIHSLFLLEIIKSIPLLIAASFIIPLLAVLANAVWALGGTLLSGIIRDPRKMKIFNVSMGIFLVYTAVSLWI